MRTVRNRGKQSNDDKLFSQKWLSVFKNAADDMCYLLSRSYAESSVTELVGNRYRLNKRQRHAITRICCSNMEKIARSKSHIGKEKIRDAIVEIDGFNLLILVESALSGAYVFKGRDKLYRDISSVHGSYKRVAKTEDAIRIISETLDQYKPKSVIWYFDSPVSNSGKLKTMLREFANTHNLNWEVELVFNPDKCLANSSNIVITSDAWILDRVKMWFNLGAEIIDGYIKEANVIDV